MRNSDANIAIDALNKLIAQELEAASAGMRFGNRPLEESASIRYHAYINARDKIREALADAVEEVESCSACYGYLIPALEMLKKEGLFEKLDEKICIGQGYRGKTGVLGVGHCTCKFQNFVEGCPPLEGEIYEFLRGYVNERTPGK